MHGAAFMKGEKAVPPEDYVKKIVHPGQGRPLTETFSAEQVQKRVSFYEELNRKREEIRRDAETVQRRFALYGRDDTTTVRVYMRETVQKIAAELLFSDYRLEVSNIYRTDNDGREDKDHGYVAVAIRATEGEIEALEEYIHAGTSYFVYDGEESKYRKGDTAASEFIIVKPDEPVQPLRFWRRSQSFIALMEEEGG
jgi:hypothetical protein